MAIRYRLLPLVCAALLWACSDDTTPPPDTGATPDTGTTPDTGGHDGPQADGPSADGPLTDGPRPDQPSPDSKVYLDAGVAGVDYVFDSIALPMNATTSAAYALELGGKKYNKLGDLLAAVVPLLKIKGLPESVQNAVCTGETINLLRVKAKSMTSAPKAIADSWVGAAASCCTSSCMLASLQCSSAAKTKCFNGTGSFQPDPAHKTAATLFGKITAGQLALGPGALKLKLSLSKGGSAVLNLKGATIKGSITPGGINTGVLAGGVPASEMGTVVLPQLAQILNKMLKDPSVPAATKQAIQLAFDTDKNGTVTGAELAANATLKPYLAGDVDVDSDGKNEVSMGIGFTAVKATITTP